jgi:hypothetical protein
MGMASLGVGIDVGDWTEGELGEVLRLDLGRGLDGQLMSAATVDACLGLLAASDLTVVDLDGPPPELHPRFREIVILVRALRRRLIHRCNLAVMARPDQAEVLELLAEHRVDVVAALPDPALSPTTGYLIGALRRFNLCGYGLPDSNLRLDLVVPQPAPGADAGQARTATAAMLTAQGVRWHGLHVVPASPASGDGLLMDLQRLAASVPPSRVLDVPCRSILRVDWDGALSTSRGDQTVALGRNVRDPAPSARRPVETDAVLTAASALPATVSS